MFIFCYQGLFASVILSTILYWVILYQPDKIVNYNLLQKIGSVYLDHTVPLVFHTIDYVFLSSIPFTRRMIPLNLLFAVMYFVFNMSYSLTVEPVYSIMDWKSPKGIGLPLITIILYLITLLLIEILNKFKLKKLGYNSILSIISGQ